MEGVVEGQRREVEEGQSQGRERREGINGGGGGAKKRGSIEEQASARGRGEKERGRKKRGERWQIFWLATIAVARGTKARYCYVCQPKYLLVHKTSYSACPKNTLLVKDYT